jgi:exodeoxyribonuclease VII small subunit
LQVHHTAAAKVEESFEQALARLEKLTVQLEDPETGLDAAIDLYEKGTVLAQECLARLEKAELRIEKLREASTQAEDPSESDSETLFPEHR